MPRWPTPGTTPTYVDMGAYIRILGVLIPELTSSMLCGPYRIPNYWGEYFAVLTNKTPIGTYRAPGLYESNFVFERMVDMAARALDLDPAEVRMRNLIRGQSSIAEAERELGWLDYPWPVALSADGRLLLFHDMGETAGPSYAVCLRSMDGSPPTRLGDGAGRALSPDGRFPLAIHLGPPQRLVLIPTGAGETLTLPGGPVETYQAADFLPDGRAVVFVGAEPSRPNRTWLQELPDGLPRPVTPEGIFGVRTSPDGRWVAVRTPDSSLALVPLEDGELRPLAKLDFPNETGSQWSADGRTLAASVYTSKPASPV